MNQWALIVGFLCSAVCAASFVNEVVKRQVKINSLVVRTDMTIHYTSAKTGEAYVFGLEAERERDLAYISFYDADEVKDLASRKLPSCPNGQKDRVCWEVNLEKAEGKLGVKMANLNALHAYAKKVKLEDPFRLTYDFETHFWSPYETKKQKTIIEYSFPFDCLDYLS